jgi:hypothetical protein
MPDADNDAPRGAEFIRKLLGAWDCCGICAGGVLARYDRQIKAQAWDEGFKQGGPMHDENYDDPDAHTRNPYRVIPPEVTAS